MIGNNGDSAAAGPHGLLVLVPFVRGIVERWAAALVRSASFVARDDLL